MDEVRQRTILLFDELNVLKTRLTIGGMSKADAREMFEDALLDAYMEGFEAAAYLLGEDSLTTDPDKVTDTLEKEYDCVGILQKFEDYFDAGDSANLANLIDSEYHRSMEKGGFDAAEAAESVRGRDVVKVWDATLDDRTRYTHEVLNGTRVGLHEYFTSESGDRGLYPGGFTTAEENANCRCVIHYEYG
jgi:hypothetical protein